MSGGVVVFERLHPEAVEPERATAESAGYDLRACLAGRSVRVYAADADEPEERAPVPDGAWTDGEGPVLVLQPGDRALVPTGLRAQLPSGYEAQIRIRSSLALKRGLVLPNAPGTIDADYPEEWFVLVHNASGRPQRIGHGERIAQAVLSRYVTLPWVEGAVAMTTERAGGFGSTGS